MEGEALAWDQISELRRTPNRSRSCGLSFGRAFSAEFYKGEMGLTSPIFDSPGLRAVASEKRCQTSIRKERISAGSELAELEKLGCNFVQWVMTVSAGLVARDVTAAEALFRLALDLHFVFRSSVPTSVFPLRLQFRCPRAHSVQIQARFNTMIPMDTRTVVRRLHVYTGRVRMAGPVADAAEDALGIQSSEDSGR
jgi:hypothetical protein